MGNKKKQKNIICLSDKNTKVPIYWSFIKRQKVKSEENVRNGSTCLMYVNKNHTLDVAGEKTYKQN